MHLILEKLTTPAAFIFVLAVTIFVHEFGHFITAKGFGIRVFVFSFGFGQRLLGFKWGETDCRLSLIPLGGYVKLEGEADDLLSEDTARMGDGKDFTDRPRWQRIIVYLAGPAMNAVLTVAVLTGVYIHGADMPELSDSPIIAAVEAGSPAADAGLQPGDEILAINGVPQPTWEDVFVTVGVRPATQIRITIRRAADTLELPVKTRANSRGIGELGAEPLVVVSQVIAGRPAAEAGVKPGDIIRRIEEKPIYAFEQIPPIVKASEGKPLRFDVVREGREVALTVTPRGGQIGITGGGRLVHKKYGPLRAVKEAVLHTTRLTQQTLGMIYQLVTASISPGAAFTGPLGIMKASGEAARTGFLPLIFLLALISISVGILNLFPLPPLDGGHLAILVLEGIIRRDLSQKVKVWIMNAGFVVLLLLIVAVFYLDITKLDWYRRMFAR